MSSPVFKLKHADSDKRVIYPLSYLCRIYAEVLGAKGHVIFYYGRYQLIVRILEDHADPAPDIPYGFIICRIKSVHDNSTRCRCQQAVKALGKSGFPRSVHAYDRNEAALFYVQTYTVQSYLAGHFLAAVVDFGKFNFQVFYLNESHPFEYITIKCIIAHIIAYNEKAGICRPNVECFMLTLLLVVFYSRVKIEVNTFFMFIHKIISNIFV